MNRLTFSFLLLMMARAVAQPPSPLRLEFLSYDQLHDLRYKLRVNGVEIVQPADPEHRDRIIPGTRYKVARFIQSLLYDRESGKILEDKSTLVLVHVDTGRLISLTIGKPAEIPFPDNPVPAFRPSKPIPASHQPPSN